MNIEEIFDEVFYSSLSIDDLRTLEELRIYYEKVAKQCDFNNHLNESITKLDNILNQFILTSDEKIYRMRRDRRRSRFERRACVARARGRRADRRKVVP